MRGRSPHASQMSETQASLESSVTAAAAQDQSGLSQSESPPVLSPIVSTAEQRRAVLSFVNGTYQPKRQDVQSELHAVEAGSSQVLFSLH